MVKSPVFQKSNRHLHPPLDSHISSSHTFHIDSMLNMNQAIFDALGIIRVYTKRVGHDADYHDPIILPIGGTIEEAAKILHKDFAYKLQFAKVWGEGKFEGQKVKNSFVLSDRDIVEFHI